MKRATAFLLACLVLLMPSGCIKDRAQGVPGEQQEVQGNPGSSRGEQAAVAEESGGGASGMVLKSDNQAPDREAVTVLEELDRQMDELLKALERMDEVKDEDLRFEE